MNVTIDCKFYGTIFTLAGYRKFDDNRQKLQAAITAITDEKNHPRFIIDHHQQQSEQRKQKENIFNDQSYCFELSESKPKPEPLIVVGIDFGTAYTGYAFVFRNDIDQIHYMRKYSSLDGHEGKVPTSLLLDYRRKFHSFGQEAKNFYYNLKSSQCFRYGYFENFKMKLYSNGENQTKIDANLKLKPINQNYEIEAMEIFSMSLEYLCQQAKDEIGQKCGLRLTHDDIVWVITVPAIWSDQSKQFIRLAAERTGLICGEMLRIALEPEVASLYCRKFLSNELRNSNSKIQSTFEPGISYLIIDLGGGTVDITAHQIQQDGFIKELHKSTGGPYGSNEINRKFEKIIEKIFGSKRWQRFRKESPSTYLDLMQAFELRKREAKPDHHTPYNILLTFSFITYFGGSKELTKLFDKNAPNGLSYSPKLGIIRIDMILMNQLFRSVIDPLIDICRQILEEQKSNNIRYMFLTGGFARSAMIDQQIKLMFESKLMVVIPSQAHLAVLYGACQYGLDPTLIRSRRVRQTYGIAIMERFDQSIHPHSKRMVSAQDQTEWCTDVFDKFVEMNQSIGLFESIKRRYKPIFSTQNSCIFHIYSTTNMMARFVTDQGVQKCGALYLELDTIQFPNGVNPAIQQLLQREIEVEMFFGETEIKITAKDLQTGYDVRSNIDFISNLNK
ncbi:hypothetical protein HUG17_3112 [Dermatophagoides farinae]|uniref:Uncharacterized protein n=1 Tax=Dermatophagoides farinae TaxID=6954 RepID=A0A9D4NVK2_DERFA|nr:hypothetical protein HUG17_3112 [Dermatophagoides farinae]